MNGAGGRLVPAVAGSVAVLIVIVAIVAGFMVVGSPGEARRRAADGERVRDLIRIADRVADYYKDSKSVPASLQELRKSEPLRDEDVEDPTSGQQYEYRRLSATTFRLCADFETDQSRSDEAGWSYDFLGRKQREMARHGKGRACFTLDVKSWRR